MSLKEDFKDKLTPINMFSVEDIQNAPLRAKIAMSYHNDAINKLKEFLELDDEKKLINKLNEFLEDNWQKIKGSSISYTALPKHEITTLCCWMAEQVCAHEKENDATFMDAPKIPLNYLMPNVSGESINLNFPIMGVVEKAEFSEEQAKQLADLSHWLEENGGTPTDEVDIGLTEEEMSDFLKLDDLTYRKKLNPQAPNKYDKEITELRKKITPEAEQKLQKQKNTADYKSLLAKKTSYDTQQIFLNQGVYKKERDYIVFKLPLAELLKTHIENAFGDGLIAVKELAYDNSAWAYSSNSHQQKERRLKELTNQTDGLILKTTQALNKEPKESESYTKLTDDLLSLQTEAQLLYKELSESQKTVLSRLAEHSEQTKALVEARNTYAKLQSDESHLLGQLLILRKRLKYADAHGGKGTGADAATDAYNAIIEFNDYYQRLSEGVKSGIPEALRAKIEELITFGSTKDLYQKGVTTCIGSIGESIERLITGHEQTLATITNSQQQKEILLKGAREKLQEKKDVLVKVY